jgi:hypothetical protein
MSSFIRDEQQLIGNPEVEDVGNAKCFLEVPVGLRQEALEATAGEAETCAHD